MSRFSAFSWNKRSVEDLKAVSEMHNHDVDKMEKGPVDENTPAAADKDGVSASYDEDPSAKLEAMPA
jgi:hypothetical protein